MSSFKNLVDHFVCRSGRVMEVMPSPKKKTYTGLTKQPVVRRPPVACGDLLPCMVEGAPDSHQDIKILSAAGPAWSAHLL